MGYYEEVLADAPSLWYRLEGNTNNSGSLSPAAMTGTVGAYTSEGAGRNADFDGAVGSGVVTTGNGNNAFANRSEPYTIEFWCKADVEAAFTHIVTLGLSSGHHIIFYKGDTGDINVYFYGENGSTSLFQINATQNMDDGNWHHVVLVHTTSSGTGHVNLYLDGALAYNPSTTHETSGSPIIAGTLRLAQDGSGTSRYKGLVDEVAVYKNVALSAGRIDAHYDAGVLEFGPNNTYVATPATGSGLAVNPAVSSAANVIASVSTGSGLSVDPDIEAIEDPYWIVVLDDNPKAAFPLNNSLLDITAPLYTIGGGTAVYAADGHYEHSTHSLAPSSVGVWGTGAMFGSRPTSASVEFWLKKTGTDAGNVFTICDTTPQFKATVDSSGNLVFHGWGSSGSSDAIALDSEWNHYVITKSSDNYIVYQNGEQVDTFSANGIGSESDWTLAIADEIGGGAAYTGGRIDSFAVYDTVLSAARVQAHYLAGLDAVEIDFPAEAMSGTGLFANPAITVAGNTQFSAGAILGSAEFVGPVISASGSASFPATPFLGSGEFPDAEVPNVEFGAEPMLGSAEIAEPTFGTGQTAEVMLGSGLINNATLDLERNTVVTVAEMNGSGTMKDPTSVNPFENDPYYSMIRGTTDTDDHWMGMDEIEGNKLRMYYGGSDPLILPSNNPVYATIYGDYTMGIDGPAGRTGIRMNDGYIEAPNKFGFASGQTVTLEAVIRTSADDGMLFMSANELVEGVIIGSPPAMFTAVYIEDGRVVVHYKRFDGTAVSTKLVGNTPINDGEWHHIVVTEGTVDRKDPKNYYIPETGVRFYIDGDLDARLSPESFDVIWSVRQAAGLPPSWIYTFDVTNNFVGDITEIVARKDMSLAHETVRNLSYPALGITPIHIDPLNGSGEMTQSQGAGNRKRALLVRISSVTNHWTDYQDTYFQPIGNLHYDTADPGQISFGGELFDGKSRMAEILEDNNQTELAEMLDYHWFETNARGPVQNPTGSVPSDLYRDEFDTTRLVNFMTDIDPTAWDVVAFADYPDKGTPNRINVAQLDFSYVGGKTMEAAAERMFEDMIDSLKQAVAAGLSLLITNPALARDMGVISGHDEVPTFRNTYWQSAGYPTVGGGFREWSLDPYGTEPPRTEAAEGGTYPSLLGKYVDNNANVRYRVTAIINGLTTIPAWVTKEYLALYFVNYFKLPEESIKYTNRNGGLFLGDEFLIEDSMYASLAGVTGALWTRYDRHEGGTKLAAVHPDKILAGTAVTKLANFIWVGEEEIINPYREYATTIAVQPGQELDGVPILGKIFFSLAEDAERLFTGATFQDLENPIGDASRIPAEKETAYSKSYQFSTWRVHQVSPNPGEITTDKIVNPITGQIERVVKGTVEGQAGVWINGYNSAMVYSPTMVGRGLAWLGGTAPGIGTVLITADQMEGEGELVTPDAEAQYNVSVGAEPMIGISIMRDPDEAFSPDVQEFVFPMSGDGLMNGFNKNISAEPMLGFGTFPDYDIISNQGEQIDLYLFSTIDDFAALYLKEVS